MYPNNKQAILLLNILLYVFGSMYYLVQKKNQLLKTSLSGDKSEEAWCGKLILGGIN